MSYNPCDNCPYDETMCQECALARAIYEKFGLSYDEVAELTKAKADGRLIVLPCKVGDSVFNICKCEEIPTQLDGTLYSHDGSPGTATGYYCPYENNCPHDTDDCEKVKDELAVFEDEVVGFNLCDNEIWVYLENTPNSNVGQFGKAVFLSREEAEKALLNK